MELKSLVITVVQVYIQNVVCVYNVICYFLTEVLDDTNMRNLIYFNQITEGHQDSYRCTAANIVGSSYQVINTGTL